MFRFNKLSFSCLFKHIFILAIVIAASQHCRTTFCRLAPRHTNIKLFFGGGNTKTKMRSIYINVAEAKKYSSGVAQMPAVSCCLIIQLFCIRVIFVLIHVLNDHQELILLLTLILISCANQAYHLCFLAQ